MQLVPQPPLSLLAAPFCVCEQTEVFFAVDTAYVAKKLGLLVFPYTPGEELPQRAGRPLCLPASCPRTWPQISAPSFALLSAPPHWPLLLPPGQEVQYSRDVPLPPRPRPRRPRSLYPQ